MDNQSYVWLLEDDDLDQFILAKIIRRLKCRLLTFSRAEDMVEALHKLKHHPENLPDLLLVDINMPVMSGWDFMHEYKRIAPQLPFKIKIYILTYSILDEDILRADKEDDVIGYITKPISQTVLSKILTKSN